MRDASTAGTTKIIIDAQEGLRKQTPSSNASQDKLELSVTLDTRDSKKATLESSHQRLFFTHNTCSILPLFVVFGFFFFFREIKS